MFESEIPVKHLEDAIASLEQKYLDEAHAFSLEKLAGGYQFLTKPAYQTSIAILQKHQSQKGCLRRSWKHFP